MPPTKNESPRTSSRLPTMLPVIDALTSATWPLRSATSAMMSSAALPNVALRKPPHAGPERRASWSVPRPMSPASGTSDAAAATNTHDEPGAVAQGVGLGWRIRAGGGGAGGGGLTGGGGRAGRGGGKHLAGGKVHPAGPPAPPHSRELSVQRVGAAHRRTAHRAGVCDVEI